MTANGQFVLAASRQIAMAARWLARRMVLEGAPLQAGEVVMSGALGPMKDLAPGLTAVATIDGLGTVSVTREVAP